MNETWVEETDIVLGRFSFWVRSRGKIQVMERIMGQTVSICLLTYRRVRIAPHEALHTKLSELGRLLLKILRTGLLNHKESQGDMHVQVINDVLVGRLEQFRHFP